MIKYGGHKARYLKYSVAKISILTLTFAPEFKRLSGEDAVSEEIIERHVNYVLALFDDKHSLS